MIIGLAEKCRACHSPFSLNFYYSPAHSSLGANERLTVSLA